LTADPQSEEPFAFEKAPDPVRYVVLVPDRPVVDYAAQLLGRAIQEGPFRLAERQRGNSPHIVEIRLAAEEFGLKTDRADPQRFARRVRPPRQAAPDGSESRSDEHGPPCTWDAEHPQYPDRNPA